MNYQWFLLVLHLEKRENDQLLPENTILIYKYEIIYFYSSKTSKYLFININKCN